MIHHQEITSSNQEILLEITEHFSGNKLSGRKILTQKITQFQNGIQNHFHQWSTDNVTLMILLRSSSTSFIIPVALASVTSAAILKP